MSEQLTEAGILMAVGMSVVFAFLTLLIGGIHSVAWLARVFPDNKNTALDGKADAKVNATSHSRASSNNKTAPTTINPNLVAAITAAVNTHRREKK